MTAIGTGRGQPTALIPALTNLYQSPELTHNRCILLDIVQYSAKTLRTSPDLPRH